MAGLVHFFMLSTFMWTAVNALRLYKAIVKVQARDNTRFMVKRFMDKRFMVKASVLAWGELLE